MHKRYGTYIYNGILLGQSEKGQLNVPFATTWMDLETIIPTDRREMNMGYLHVSLNDDTVSFSTEQKQIPRQLSFTTEKQRLPNNGKGRWGKGWRGLGD